MERICFNLQVDCESTQASIADPALGERAIRGVAEVCAAEGLRATFVVIPGDMRAHAPVYRELEAQGAEVDLLDLKTLVLPIYDGDVEDAGFPAPATGYGVHHVPGREDPAVQDFLFGLFAPAVEDGNAGKIDEDLLFRGAFLPRARNGAVRLDEGYAGKALPVLDRAVKNGHLMASGNQGFGQCRADESRAACDENPHCIHPSVGLEAATHVRGGRCR